jgi:hypothetical protein
MQSFCCPYCLSPIIVPELAEDIKNKLVTLIRDGSCLTAVREFTKHGLDLSSSKVTAIYITKVKGVCNRCKNDKLDDGVVTCENCKALNINW